MQVYLSVQQQQLLSLNPWYYWVSYLNQVYSPVDEPSTQQPQSTPCIEPYCLDGEVLNTTTCKCAFPTDTTLPTEKPPSPLPTNSTPTCSITECPQGQSLDDANCKCTCPHTAVRCSGLRRYNATSCKCECTHPYPCKQHRGEQFNTVLCVCIPTQPYRPLAVRPRPIVIRPTSAPPFHQLPPIFIPLQQQRQQLCRPIQCSGYKIFDMSRCACYCPLSAATAGQCNGGKAFNTDSCQCECPLPSLPGAPRCASSLHYFDNNDCSCKCRVLNSVCGNDLQIFNPNTCQCQCQRVYITIRRQTNGPILQYKRSIRNEHNTHKEVQEEEKHVVKRMTRTRTKTHRRRGNQRPSTPVVVQQPQYQISPTQTIIAYTCPVGSTMDQNTCSCI